MLVPIDLFTRNIAKGYIPCREEQRPRALRSAGVMECVCSHLLARVRSVKSPSLVRGFVLMARIISKSCHAMQRCGRLSPQSWIPCRQSVRQVPV